ncbi:hydroxycinnamoyl-CoA shikimate/quinate hydroxycinnamoyl transferase [Quillaja saponaria]|uniref:Hydroxycinnamoyl-CoA shikimate/quinate hydroxycinnamoyl transferase n=1 Tax=Quillaja saponaria TaxID=32244 RepID=A0AAD7L858_QUISA|nr:hydroxycinnamoyl-CoA shikimate/quinate hydroxycinnamoyl transferase [Quillaja saponaria]
MRSSCMVTPSKPTPNDLLSFSKMDLMVPMNHFPPVIFFYKPNHNNNNNLTNQSAAVETIKNSLKRILVHYYPFSGRFRRINIKGDQQLVLECNAMGVQFFEADYLNVKMSDYIELFDPDKATKKLVPHVDYSIPIEEWPLMLVQVTKFSCGGLSLCLLISHTLVDGVAMYNFIKLWTKLGSRFDHSGFKAPPLLLGCSNATEVLQKETTPVVMKVFAEQIKKLKKEVNEENTHLHRPYSTYEVVAAHIWRCACMARQGDKDQPTVIRIVADIRNRLKPKIPKNFVGNVVLPVLTPTCLYGEILSNRLSYTAQKIREATVVLTDEYIRSALDYAEKMEAKQVHALGYESKGGYFYGNPNLSVGSVIGVPIYDVDFGWGKPVFYSPGNLGSQDGKLFMAPSPDGDGSLFIHLRFQTQYFQAFKEFFYGVDQKDDIIYHTAQSNQARL